MHLIISEKYNAAERIANILCDGSPGRETVSDTPVFKWRGTRCVGLAGHVVEVDFEDGYGDWNAVHPSELATAGIEKQASKPGIVSAVKQLASEADRVTIATDYDREGELIGKEAYELVKSVNDSVPVDRVRFSSLTAPEVTAAFENPVSLDFDLAAAGEARQIIDLRWGASLTRFLTLAASRGDGVISVGRVQTPTLALLVEREREIQNFNADPYWELYADLTDPPDGTPFQAQYYYRDSDGNQAERVWDASTANTVYRDLNAAFKATVVSVDETRRNDNPPVPFSTTEFIKAANAIGIDAKPAMNTAESLYDDGYITYPRTDNTVYPDDLEPRSLLAELRSKPVFTGAAEQLLEHDVLTATEGDSETTDHPPIHPTADLPDRSALSDREWDVYELVVRRFFATFADAAVWNRTRVDAEVTDHLLTASGKRLVDPGYHAVYPYFDTEESSIPSVSEGDMLQIGNVELAEKETQPPNRYGQSQLIERMESLGLGTKSTRHNTIDTLYDRGYIQGNPPEPTALAMALITAVEEHATQVGTVEMTSQLESNMTAIADGDTSLETVTTASVEMLEDVFRSLSGSEDAIRDELQKHIQTTSDSTQSREDAVGDCPECGELLFPRSVTDDSKFIGCEAYPDCEFTLPLPNKGRVHLLDEVCGEHDLQHVKMIAGSATEVFGCPQCQKELAEQSGMVVLDKCPDCSQGKIGIKRVQTGSRLVGCTEYPDCEYTLPFPKHGDVHVTDSECATHNLPEVEIRKDEYNSPWEIGCPVCNAESFNS